MNTEGIVLKNVEFDGALLRAAQVENIVWVGVRWVCLGIGLSNGQARRQIENIQKDELLHRGCRKFATGVFDENNETLALQLDYLPAWLFKISITPKMKADHPELVEKLIRYQLKAKDVLAQAFLPEISNTPERTEIEELKELKELKCVVNGLAVQITDLYNNVSKMGNLLLDMREHKPILTIEQKEKAKDSEVSYLWKQKMYEKMDILIELGKFESRADIMKYIYKYMNRNYGIVWEQEIKDYVDRNNSVKKPSTIEAIYDNEMLRSIFDAVLSDMVGEVGEVREAGEVREVGEFREADGIKRRKNDSVIVPIDDIIKPLIQKNCDLSNAGMATYRSVYRYMDENYSVNWKNLQTRYCKKYGIYGDPRKISRKKLIEGNEGLRKKFEKAVNDLLEG